MKKLRNNVIFYNFLIKLLKRAHKRSSVLKYAYLQDGFLYITDTRMLFQIKAEDVKGYYDFDDKILRAEQESRMPQLLENFKRSITGANTQELDSLEQMYKKDFDDRYSFDIEKKENFNLFKFLRLCTISKIEYLNKKSIFHIVGNYNDTKFELYVVS